MEPCVWCDVSLIEAHTRSRNDFQDANGPADQDKKSRSASKQLTLMTSIRLTVHLNFSHNWPQFVSQFTSISLTIDLNPSHVKERKSLFCMGFSDHQSIQRYSKYSKTTTRATLWRVVVNQKLTGSQSRVHCEDG
jgi:hypothetical protein